MREGTIGRRYIAIICVLMVVCFIAVSACYAQEKETFGANANINVAGLVASTLHINDSDL